ncbi:tRNA-5-carboxymethylaminomethyl-2-thiouridine(34)synthesis protein MnmE, partial [hydrothermal vent metagenome]
MFKLEGMEDTIVAISTAMGQGSIGLIRLSGKESVRIADKLFKAKSGKLIAQCKTFTVHYGSVVDEKGDIIDEVLLTVMKAPKSYTTEDIVEISCHGGVVSLKSILNR